jgi:serine/threonine protein kinase
VGETLPRQFGAYQLLQKLGQGGASDVYLARSVKPRPDLPTPLVIKCLRQRLERFDEAMKRFQHEARIAVSVDDPHVVKVFDVGSVNEALYIAMEHIRGWPVIEVINAYRQANRYPSLPFVLRLARGGLRGLHALHAAVNPETMIPLGVVHRDVSAKNVMIGVDGQMKLIDLGLGRSNVQEWQTRMGVLLGTPGYMSPEQVMGDRLDHRSDLYSFAVVFFELIVLEHFLPGNDVQSILNESRTPKFRRLSDIRNDLPAGVDEMFEKALALRPEDRFESALEFLNALEAIRIDEDAPSAPDELPPPLEANLRRMDEDVERLLLLEVLDSEPEEGTIVFADRTAPMRKRPFLSTTALVDPPDTNVTELETGISTLDDVPSTTDERPHPLAEEVAYNSPTRVPAQVLISARPPRTIRVLVIAMFAIATLGSAVLITGALLSDPIPIEAPLDLPVPLATSPAPDETPKALPRANQTPEAEPHALPPPPSTPPRKERPTRIVEPMKIGIEPRPAVPSGESIAAESKAILHDAARLRARFPARAGEIDEIVADVSIWSGSTEYERAGAALRALRARLAHVSDKP